MKISAPRCVVNRLILVNLYIFFFWIIVVMASLNREELMKKVDELVRKCLALANPYRVLILAVVAARVDASWSEVKTALEALLGPVNPNTLAFHINQLVSAGYLERFGPQRSPRYRAKEVPREIEELLKNFRSRR